MNRIRIAILALIAVALLSHRPTLAQEQQIQSNQQDESAISNPQEPNSSDAPAIETRTKSTIEDLDDAFGDAVKNGSSTNS